MKMVLGFAAILFAVIGMISGITDWALSNYVLDDVDWDGPLASVQIFCWLMTSVGFGLAIIFSAIAGIIKE